MNVLQLEMWKLYPTSTCAVSTPVLYPSDKGTLGINQVSEFFSFNLVNGKLVFEYYIVQAQLSHSTAKSKVL